MRIGVSLNTAWLVEGDEYLFIHPWMNALPTNNRQANRSAMLILKGDLSR